uniref:Tetratricopeptide repeat domain 12 n=1 Tax=Cyprinus carpio TaxID=7962 RepID=A0A8C2JBF2_CYPCA
MFLDYKTSSDVSAERTGLVQCNRSHISLYHHELNLIRALKKIYCFVLIADELVKELNSSNVSRQVKAISKADQFISSLEQKEPCKTKINKTVINKNPSSENGPVNFLRILEKDAEERRLRRKMKEEKANALREQGNEAFTQGDYETAVRFYTEGLEQLRDMQALYTNRAQAFIKLKRYKEAISDCEWALRCNEKCIKAYVHMGKSHLALKDFKQSRICYQKILEIEPQRETMVKAYLRQVDLEEKASLQEKAAWEELQEGTEQAMAVAELLKKLDRPNEINLYYCGGLELLSQAIKDCKEHMVQLLASPVREIQRESLELLSMYSQTQHGRDVLIANLNSNQYVFFVGGEMSSRYSIKALTFCTASIPQARDELVKLDKRLHTLRNLLGSIDELVVGNAALCLGHCLEVDGAAVSLLGTDCVQLLLHHAAGDAKRAAVQQNAAITLGKLCKIEPRHMEKLRELHGLEILHSCVRLIT